jgi:hypothetical protein
MQSGYVLVLLVHDCMTAASDRAPDAEELQNSLPVQLLVKMEGI